MDSLQIVAALALYLFLFGWIGYRRGSLRELIVLLVTLGGWLVLRQYQGEVVTLFNFAYKFLVFAREGGLAGDNPDAILLIRDAPNLFEAEQGEPVIFFVWLVALILAYLATTRVGGSRNRSDTTAILLGVANGLIYFSIFLPLLGSILVPGAADAAEPSGDGLSWVLGNTITVVGDALEEFWLSVDDQQPLVIIALLTVVLVYAASTLRGSSAKS